MKTRSKRALTFVLAALMVVIIGFSYYEFMRPKYNVVDFFTDSTDKAKIVFMFVEVNSLNDNFLYNVSRNLKADHPSMTNNPPGMLSILVAHYYQIEDTVPPGENMLRRLESFNPQNSDLKNKLDFIENAKVYTGANKKVPSFVMPMDTLFPAPIFVPKKGVKAKDVLKSPKPIFWGNDKEKVNFPDKHE